MFFLFSSSAFPWRTLPILRVTRTPLRFTAFGEQMAKLDLNNEPVQRLGKLMQERKTTLEPTMACFSQTHLSQPGKECPSDTGWVDHAPVTVQRARRESVSGRQTRAVSTLRRELEEDRGIYNQGIPLVPRTDDYSGFVLHSEMEALHRPRQKGERIKDSSSSRPRLTSRLT